MQKGISIIICTYNGAGRIEETILAAAAQQFTFQLPWEIIVVDNASTDNTASVVRQVLGGLGSQKELIELDYEAKPGKIYALHRGVDRARYTYFIICDDDNRLARNYAQTAFEVLDVDPAVGAVGGQSEADTAGEPLPEWFFSIQGDYAVGAQGNRTGDVSARGYLWGAGMASRTDLYKAVYREYPSFLTGRNGQMLTAGEDSEYCQRLLLKGYKLWYDERLLFRHYIPPQRLQPAYREGLLKGLHASDVILDKYRFANQLKERTHGSAVKKFGMFLTALIKYPFAFSERKKERATDKLNFLSPVAIKKDNIMSVLRSMATQKNIR